MNKIKQFDRRRSFSFIVALIYYMDHSSFWIRALTFKQVVVSSSPTQGTDFFSSLNLILSCGIFSPHMHVGYVEKNNSWRFGSTSGHNYYMGT